MGDAQAAGDRVLVVGESLLDVVRTHDGSETEYVGGSPLNVACGLARLGRATTLATCLGQDGGGRRVREHVEEHDVDLAPGSMDGQRHTSTALAHVGDDGAADYTFDLVWDLTEVAPGDDVGHLHTGSLGAVVEPGGSVVRAALGELRDRMTISFDPNVRPGVMGDLSDVRELVESILPDVDVVKASADDLSLLYPGADHEAVLARWGDLGPALTVLTRGADGVVVRLTGRGESGDGDAGAVDVVDTVGAGDSFMAGLLSGLLDAGLLGSAQARERLRTVGLADVSHAVARGSACAARTVGREGAYAPTLDEL